MRRLRKANIEFEEQNRVLQRHIKDMYNAKERLEAELGMDEKRTQALHQHLLTIKQTLVSSLSTVPLPGQRSGALVKYISSAKQQCVKCVCNGLLYVLITLIRTNISYSINILRTGLHITVFKLFGLNYCTCSFLNRFR